MVRGAVRALGVKAETQHDGTAVIVVLMVGDRVSDQYPEPRGLETASRDVARFNKDVAERKVNPSVDAVRR